MMNVIKPVIDKLTPSCEIISKQISRSMDEPLTMRERVQVKLHLMACKLCVRYRDQLLAIRKKIRDHVDEWEENSDASEVHLSDEKKTRMKRLLSDESSKS